MSDNIVDLEVKRELRDWDLYISRKRKLRADFLDVVIKHYDNVHGCTDSMIIDQLEDVIEIIKSNPKEKSDA